MPVFWEQAVRRQNAMKYAQKELESKTKQRLSHAQNALPNAQAYASTSSSRPDLVTPASTNASDAGVPHHAAEANSSIPATAGIRPTQGAMPLYSHMDQPRLNTVPPYRGQGLTYGPSGTHGIQGRHPGAQESAFLEDLRHSYGAAPAPMYPPQIAHLQAQALANPKWQTVLNRYEQGRVPNKGRTNPVPFTPNPKPGHICAPPNIPKKTYDETAWKRQYPIFDQSPITAISINANQRSLRKGGKWIVARFSIAVGSAAAMVVPMTLKSRTLDVVLDVNMP